MTVTDAPVSLRLPMSMWSTPTGGADGSGQWIVPANDPKAATGQSAPAWSYDYTAWFGRNPPAGNITLSLSVGPEGKRASFTVQNPDLTTVKAQVPLAWKAGGSYFLYTYHLGGGRWGAWVVDGTTGVVTTIGVLAPSPQQTKLFNPSTTTVRWFGAAATSCTTFPRARVMVMPPVAFVGAQVVSSALSAPTVHGTGCPSTATTYGSWAVLQVGGP